MTYLAPIPHVPPARRARSSTSATDQPSRSAARSTDQPESSSRTSGIPRADTSTGTRPYWSHRARPARNASFGVDASATGRSSSSTGIGSGRQGGTRPTVRRRCDNGGGR